MDNLLAGYGSDSDESSSSVAHSKQNRKSSQETKSAPISSLLGDGVDSCSSSSDDEQITPDRKQLYPLHPSHKKEIGIHQKRIAQANKKQRLHEDNNNIGLNQKGDSSLTRNTLPRPQIATLGSSSMVFWTIDYVSQKASPTVVDNSTTAPPQFQRFEKLVASRSYDPQKGWAAHLRNQNDFHNPNWIQSTIEKLGIKEPLGSQAEKRTPSRQRRFQGGEAGDLDF